MKSSLDRCMMIGGNCYEVTVCWEMERYVLGSTSKTVPSVTAFVKSSRRGGLILWFIGRCVGICGASPIK